MLVIMAGTEAGKAVELGSSCLVTGQMQDLVSADLLLKFGFTTRVLAFREGIIESNKRITLWKILINVGSINWCKSSMIENLAIAFKMLLCYVYINCFFLLKYSWFTILYEFQAYSIVAVICILHMLFCLIHYYIIMLSIVPCAIQLALISYLFYLFLAASGLSCSRWDLRWRMWAL